MLQHLKLSAKITLGFGVVLTLLALVAWFGFSGTRQALNGLVRYRELARENINISGLNDCLLQTRLDVKEYYLQRADNAIKSYEKTAAQLNSQLSLTEQATPDLQRLDKLKAFGSAFGQYEQTIHQIVSLAAKTSTPEQISQLEAKSVQLGSTMSQTVDDLREAITRDQGALGALVQGQVQRAVTLISLLVCAAMVLGILAAFFLTRTITSALRKVIQDLSAGSEQTASASGQVAATSQSMAEGASEQAASIEETSASMEEISSMIQRNAQNAQKATELARQTHQAADQGARDMQTMTQAMHGIQNSSADIAKIIKTIDEIAFQTNILALNAAVEAARAGEAGMGFAVVADEVRSLAQRSAQAAKETAAKIEGAITNTRQGVSICDTVAKGLQRIVEQVRQVDELVAEVSTASKEQSQGIAQVNLAITQMDKITQTNAASAEESASAAEELNAQAVSLQESVQHLIQVVDGQGALRHTPVKSNAPGSSRSTEPAKPSAAVKAKAATKIKAEDFSRMTSARPAQPLAHNHKSISPLQNQNGLLARAPRPSAEEAIPMAAFKDF